MKICSRSLSVVLTLLSLANPLGAAGTANENIMLDPLGGNWQVGFQQKRGGTAIIEFVHAGESVHDWTEMATLLGIDQGKGMDIDTYIDRVRSSLKQRCSRGPNVKILSKTPVSGLPARMIVVECQAYASGKAESYVQMAVAGRQALYSFQLARKVPRLDAETSSRFARFVRKLKICDDADPARPCLSSH